MTPRIGRPVIENPRKNREFLRLNDEELKKLEHCQKQTGLSKSDVIRLGIDKVYQGVIKEE